VATVATATTGTGPIGMTLNWWRRSEHAWPVAVLVVVPVLAFAVPAVTGHPPISFDNLIQNFPLRTLSGADIRQGHLPLWNPTIWGGSPLLGGLNAGSFYPGTLLFAGLPAMAAWVLNVIGVYWAAGLGMYALLRQFSLRPTACLLAAVTYQFGGAMTGQLVHFGVVQAMAWMPLVVLAELRLSWAVLGTGPSPEYRVRPPAPTSPWPWVALLAAAIGLILLTGEPRGMGEAEIVASFVLVWLAVRSYSGGGVDLARRARFVAYGVVAAAWAAAIGAAQLLPGHTFILASQRANTDYAFFGAGSLKPSWTILMLVQNLWGGNAILGQPAYANTYNLPEVTGYVGLLPLVAFVVLAVRSFGPRSDSRARDWRPWLFLAVLGLLLTWGTFTPLGHVFAQIPFYNKLRLDSRSLGIVDLALAISFGFWLELFMAGEWRERVARRGRRLREVAAPMLAPAAGLTAAVVALALPATVLVEFGANPANAPGERPWMAAQAAVAGGAVLTVWAWRRWSPVAARRLLTIVVVADLGLFALTCSTGMFSGGRPQPTRAVAAPVVGTTGRFAIVQPEPNINELSSISEPDLNALTGLDSVQGYGSIVSGHYEDETGTHFLSSMDPCALARGVFVPLRLSTLFVRAPSLITRLDPGAVASKPVPCPGAPPAGTVAARTWYLGRDLVVQSVAVVVTGRSSSAATAPKIGLLSPSGTTTWPTEHARATRTGWTVTLARPHHAVGIVAHGQARRIADTSTLGATGGTRYALNGQFQDALGQTSWRPAGFFQDYARFRTDKIAPRVAVLDAPGATVRRVSTTEWGTETDVVDTPAAATVVRSEAYLAGWRVRAQPVGGGATLTLPVFAVGLVQGVRVPAGRWRLTFDYWPPGLTSGGIASALGVAALLAVAGVGLARRRRARERPVAGGGQ
jgi:hypothetical protein